MAFLFVFFFWDSYDLIVGAFDIVSEASASWEFGFNGQLCLLFDSKNGFWTMVHSKGRRMREKWENDRGVTYFFKKVSMGDCWAWLQDFVVCWEKMLKTSGT